MAGRILGDQKINNSGHFKNLELFIDNRGGCEIDPTAVMGFRVAILTQAHYPDPHGGIVDRPVKIGKDAFVGSFSVLYNCTIGEGAMVTVGSVVRSRIVRPYTIVEGNPAKEVAVKLKSGGWLKYDREMELKHIAEGEKE